ncbi:two-component system regulatory protein YycI [Bacillus tianshenii]|nr:two-component system regulatory protein YycI [Bacillus tianshenii]
MDWNKIKTIFILTFLILDLFLVFQFIDKRNASSQLSWIRETKIEEQLQAENISYPDIPEETVEEPFIRAEKKKFTRQELEKLTHQTITLIHDGPIVSILDKPYPLHENNVEDRLEEFLESYVYDGREYKVWKWNKETNKLLLFQTYNDRMIYYNENGLLSIQLDEKNQIIGYEQAHLENIQEVDDEGNNQDILQGIRALESLYRKNYLTYGSNVSNIELGYYKVVPLSGDVQFFAPTWHIQINEETNYFVNAIEGQIMELVEGGVENNEFTF